MLLFAMGFVVGSSPHPVGSAPDYYDPYRALRDWFAKDAAGFFTFWLFLIGAGQVVLFYVQLRLIRASLDEPRLLRMTSETGTARAYVWDASEFRVRRGVPDRAIPRNAVINPRLRTRQK